MKRLLFLLLLSAPGLSSMAQHKLVKLWETDTVVAVPESVLPDFKTGTLYVSQIDGGGWDADGRGGVAKLSVDGKNFNPNWITGLNAPKGLGRFGNRIYAADISEGVVIDARNGRGENKSPCEGATGLNDITVDDKGIVYVSDSRTSKIHRIENDQPTVYLE